jgi:hypothetical protein
MRNIINSEALKGGPAAIAGHQTQLVLAGKALSSSCSSCKRPTHSGSSSLSHALTSQLKEYN